MFFKKNKSREEIDQTIDAQCNPAAEADQVTNPESEVEIEAEELPATKPEQELPTETSDPGGDTIDEDALEEALSAWCKEREIDDTQQEKIMETILAIRHSMRAGDDTPTLFELARKASDYDSAIVRATSDGELKGRNLAIEEIANGEPQDDGMPHFSSYAYNTTREMPSIFRIAQDAL
ncbi:MAG: hypothetical protein ACI4AK_03750 [Lepagella sp.]